MNVIALLLEASLIKLAIIGEDATRSDDGTLRTSYF
jgi:hypothetical protein